MKLLFIWLGASDSDELVGVRKKIRWQLKAMRESGITPWLTYSGETQQYLMQDGQILQLTPIPPQGMIRRTIGIAKAVVHIAHKIHPDVIYIRWSPYEFSSAGFLGRLKKCCSHMLLEIPTYPYDREEWLLLQSRFAERKPKQSISLGIRIFFERSHRFLLKRYVDEIVTYMPSDTIWGIPVKVLENGVDVDQTPLKRARKKDMPFDLVLISVAFNQRWNGYDRILRGMAAYKAAGNSRRIFYRVVGSGPEIPRLKALAMELHLENEVAFYGTCDGAKLDALFDESDIAVSTIAYHRVKLENSGSTLKVKEYCARGIPFIYASDERALRDNHDFALRVDSSDDPLNIDMLFRFAETMRQDSNVGVREREFAQRHYDWKQQIGKLFYNTPF